jgi:hypothetical protein
LDQFVVHSFAEDDPIECRDYVRGKLGLPPWQPGQADRSRTVPARAARDAREEHEMADEEIERIERAQTIWSEAQDPRRTLAEHYLHSHRKLDLPDDLAGTVLRFHPRCPFGKDETGRTVRVPALIAAFRHIRTNAITAIHRIGLNPDAGKISRMMLGIAGGAAVKLRAPTNGTLVIAEGVETSMAAQELDLGPAWALGSVGAIRFFATVPDVRHLIIAEEAGQRSADAVRHCARRWSMAGRRVTIANSEVGSDLNDGLIELKKWRAA